MSSASFLTRQRWSDFAGAVLVEAHDEWAVAAERRYLSEGSMKPH
jgi:hypothetical protein